MKRKKVFKVFLTVIILVLLIGIILFRFFPHTVTSINIIFDGKEVSMNDTNISYFEDGYSAEESDKISKPLLFKELFYLVSLGRYGPQGFLIKLNPSIFKYKNIKPIEISFSYWNTDQSYRRLMTTIIEIEKTEKPLIYKGTLWVVSKLDDEFYSKQQFKIDLSKNNVARINLENINQGP